MTEGCYIDRDKSVYANILLRILKFKNTEHITIEVDSTFISPEGKHKVRYIFHAPDYANTCERALKCAKWSVEKKFREWKEEGMKGD